MKNILHILFVLFVFTTTSSCVKNDEILFDEKNASSDIWQVEDIEGGVNIVSYKGNETRVVFPQTVDGKTVLRIGTGDNVLAKVKNEVTSIDLSYCTSVKELYGSAFSDYENLIDVKFPDQLEYLSGFNNTMIDSLDLSNITGLKVISRWAFVSCPELQWVSFPEQLEDLGGFFLNPKLEHLDLSYVSGLKIIRKNAFSFNENLQTVEFPKQLEVIDGFSNTKLEVVDLSNVTGLTKIDENAFCNIENLENIKWSPQIYEIYGFTNIGIRTLDLRDVTGLRIIGFNSFSECGNLESVILNGELYNLMYSPFENCPLLTKLTLGKDDETSPPERNGTAFKNTPIYNGTDNAKIYYPKERDYNLYSDWENLKAEWVAY